MDLSSSETSDDLEVTSLDEYIASMKAEEGPTISDLEMKEREYLWPSRRCSVAWIIQTHYKCGLVPETMFLAVSLLDRYCSIKVVLPEDCLFVGCIALTIAAKYEERSRGPPATYRIRDEFRCCYNTSQNTAKSDGKLFSRMEGVMLDALGWNVRHYTIHAFLEALLLRDQITSGVDVLARYISEMTILHEDSTSRKPSITALRCIHGAQYVLAGSAARLERSEIAAVTNMIYSLPVKFYGKHELPHYLEASEKLDRFIRSRRQTAGLEPPQNRTSAFVSSE